MITKRPNDGYELPKSSEKGQPFVDFNEVLRAMAELKRTTRIVKKRRTNGRL